MGDSEYLHVRDICLKYNFTMYLQTQIRYKYLANMFCITVIKKLNNDRRFANTGVRL